MGNFFSKSKKSTIVPSGSSMVWVHALQNTYMKPIGEPLARKESKRITKTSCSSRSSTRRGSYTGMNGESCRDFTHDDMIQKLRSSQRVCIKK
jgi:hypothetical protein